MTELEKAHARIEELEAQEVELCTLYGIVQAENGKLRAELAAMRATVEPVAEMVPFHTPSGKRVAVISRFQHLPIGTKLYTHPSPPEGIAGWTKASEQLPPCRDDQDYSASTPQALRASSTRLPTLQATCTA